MVWEQSVATAKRTIVLCKYRKQTDSESKNRVFGFGTWLLNGVFFFALRQGRQGYPKRGFF